MTLLAVSHVRQREHSDCLVACAAMVLDYMGHKHTYEHLALLLRLEAHGTIFGHLRFLENASIAVAVSSGSIATIHDYLHGNSPIIVAVETGEFTSYWKEAVSHAVVVIGLEANEIILNDPASEETPHRVHIDEFELAWQEMDYRYAVIRPR